MASLDILCSNPLNLKSKITKIERKKIFCGPSKILKNISWTINICLKYFMTPTKPIQSPSYILNVRSLNRTRKYPVYLSKNNSNCDSFIALPCSKKLWVSLRGITSKHHIDFYFLNCLHSFVTEKKREFHKKSMWK